MDEATDRTPARSPSRTAAEGVQQVIITADGDAPVAEPRTAPPESVLDLAHAMRQYADDSERRFRSMADAAPVMIWTAGADGLCTWFNAPRLAFTRRAMDDELGDGWLESVHTDDLGQCTEVARAAVAARTPFEVEYRLRRHDAVYRWMLVRAVPRINEHAAFDGFIGTCVDISERYALLEAEQAARRDAERASERLAALQSVTSLLGQAHTAMTVGETVMSHGLAALGAARGSLMLLDEAGTTLCLKSSSGYDEALRSAFASVAVDAQYPMGNCVRSGSPVLLASRVECDTHYPALSGMRATDEGALVALPLRIGGRVIGALGATWTEPRAFDPDEQAFLLALADQTALALERARLFDAEQAARAASERQLLNATLLQRVTGALSSALTPQAVADVVLTEAAASVDAIAGSVTLMDTDQVSAREVAAFGSATLPVWSSDSLTANGSPEWDVVQTKRPVYITGAPGWEARYPGVAPLMRDLGIGATAVLPIIFDDRVQGIIRLSWPTARKSTAEERALLEALAAQCGQALERARLFDAAAAAQARAEFLADATQMLASSLQYETTIARVARAAVPRLADWCSVDVIDDPDSDVWPPTLESVVVTHADPEKIEWAESLRTRHAVKWDQPFGLPEVLRRGKTQFVPHMTDEMLVGRGLAADDLALARELALTAYCCVPLRARGRTLGALTLCMAESGRHYTEADHALAEELAQRAATAVDNARLLRDAEREREAAEQANHAKAEFLTIMSHELRTPLNAIGGYAQMLELGVHGATTDAQRTVLARIQQSQHHLLGLINEVLNYARLEAGSVHYALADVAMPAALRAVEPLVRPQADAKGLVLTFEECLEDVVVRADAEKLQQVLINLLSNAIKFTAPSGTVVVACARRPPTADTVPPPLALVDIKVRDTGVGIAPDQLERIFEPFVQVGRSRYGPGQGAGLGLAISRDLARGMSGELTAESALGNGSTFTLTLAAVV